MLVAFLLALSFVAPLKPQPHPRMFLTPATMSELQSRVAANSLEWRQLVGTTYLSGLNCTRLTTGYESKSPDGLPFVAGPGDARPAWDALGLKVPSSNPGMVNLALCYQMTKNTNPAQAAKYLAMVKKFLNAIADPFVTVVIDGETRAAANLSNAGPDGQAYVDLRYGGAKVGQTVTVSGSRGCPEANGARVVAAAPSIHAFTLNYPDGKPVICPSSTLDQSWGWLRDAGYDIRTVVPQAAIAYDWVHEGIADDTDLKNRLFAVLNTFMTEFKVLARYGHPQEFAPQSNYHAHLYSAIGLLGIATRGENPRGEEWYQEWRNEMHFKRDQPYFQRWLGNSGGFPEAYPYMRDSAPALMFPLIANYTANNENLINGIDAKGAEVPAFPWPKELMQYIVHATTPDGLHFMDRGYEEAPDTTPWDTQRWAIYPALMAHYAGMLSGDPFAAKFNKFIKDREADYFALTGGPVINLDSMAGLLWARFLFWDPNAPSEDWTTEPLSKAMGSNPAGGYALVNMRSSWAKDGILGSFMVCPVTSDAYNGKERYDKGSLIIERAGVNFLVNPVGEAARTHVKGSTAHSYFNTDVYHYSLWYLNRPGWTSRQHPNKTPGQSFNHELPEFPTRIDLYEDGGSYVYSRGVDIEKTYTTGDSGIAFFPMERWTREVVYVRPKVWVVYDRTAKKNGKYSYSQYMGWAVGKTPGAVESPNSTMRRVSVSDGETFKGAITAVLPENANVNIEDAGSYGVLYHVQVSPAADADEMNWLTVLDGADSAGSVADVERLSGSGVDAVRLNGSDVVGFANGSGALSYAFAPKANGTHIIAGLTPGGKYTVEKTTLESGLIRITIAADEAGAFEASASAGVLSFDGDSPTPKASTGSCSVTVSPLSQSVVAAGGSVQLAVAAEAGCAWTLSTPPSWIAASSSLSGSGNGTIVLAVSANTSGARSSALSIGGKTVTIQQQAAATGCSYTLAPASLSSVAAGGTQSVGVTTDAACTWTASSSLSWATIVTPTATTSAKGTGAAQVKFAANTGAARSGTITVAGKTVLVSQSAATSCSYAVMPTSLTAVAGGSTLSVSITAAAGCSWTASSSLSWVTFPSGSSGSGNATLQIKVAANTGAGRSGTITVAGKTVTINQPTAACAFTVSPTTLNSSSSGGVLSISVSTSTGCGWTATSGLSWALISSGSAGSGNGTVQVKVTANTGLARSGTITVAGKTVTISQADGVCSYSVSPTSASISKAGGTLSFQVTATAGCSWTAKSASPWATVTSGAGPLTGNGTVKVSVAPNTSGVARSGYVAITNKLITISQSAQ